MSNFSFNLHDFVFAWWGLLYEALPFVALGALMSGCLERCVSRETIVRFFPRSRLLGIAGSACIGLVFPMCECGVVPVVRRLIAKGVPASCAVAYMLASPIINPVVILSTAIAFRNKGQWTVVGLRVGLGYLVAIVLGAVVWRILGEENLLLAETAPSSEDASHQHHARGNIVVDALTTASEDFLQIGATLVVGAALAALINSGFSRTAMEPFAGNPLAAVSGMSLLAIALNLCSEADAFVAASFYAFPLAAKMAFLVLGPMVDMKLLLMYSTVFRPKAIVLISGLTIVLIWILCVTGYAWMPAVNTTAR